MTFGYNANLFANTAEGRTFNFAESLLSQLDDKRRGTAV